MRNPVYSRPVKSPRLIEIRERKSELRRIIASRTGQARKRIGPTERRNAREEFHALGKEEERLIKRAVSGSAFVSSLRHVGIQVMKPVDSIIDFGRSVQGGFRIARTKK